MKTRSETNASDPRTTQMMHPTFKSVSRRHFLRGLGGVAVGLPFLEALAPRSAQAQTAAAIQRFGVFMGCNGVDMGR